MTTQTSQTEIRGKARARFFTGFGVETLPVLVTEADSVLVWDSVAGHYTTCHRLSQDEQRRIARRVRKQAQ